MAASILVRSCGCPTNASLVILFDPGPANAMIEASHCQTRKQIFRFWWNALHSPSGTVLPVLLLGSAKEPDLEQTALELLFSGFQAKLSAIDKPFSSDDVIVMILIAEVFG